MSRSRSRRRHRGLRYEATIETPDGRRYRDRGISNVVVGDVDGFGPGGSPFEFLSEYFLSDLAAPELICEKLKEHKNDPDKSKCKDDDH